MGLFDTFKTPELEEKHKRAVSRHFKPEIVGEEAYAKGLKNLASWIAKFSRDLEPDEEILLLSSSSFYSDFAFRDNVYIITNKKIAKLTNQPDLFTHEKKRAYPLSQIADVQLKQSRSGSTFSLYVLSHEATQYGDILDDYGNLSMGFLNNSILFDVHSEEALLEFDAALKNVLNLKTVGDDVTTANRSNSEIEESVKREVEKLFAFLGQGYTTMDQEVAGVLNELTTLGAEARRRKKLEILEIAKAHGKTLAQAKGLSKEVEVGLSKFLDEVFIDWHDHMKKDADSLEIKIDNILTSYAIPTIFKINVEERGELFKDLEKFAEKKRKAGDTKAIEKAQGYILQALDNFDPRLFPSAQNENFRQDAVRLITATLNGEKV